MCFSCSHSFSRLCREPGLLQPSWPASELFSDRVPAPLPEGVCSSILESIFYALKSGLNHCRGSSQVFWKIPVEWSFSAPGFLVPGRPAVWRAPPRASTGQPLTAARVGLSVLVSLTCALLTCPRPRAAGPSVLCRCPRCPVRERENGPWLLRLTAAPEPWGTAPSPCGCAGGARHVSPRAVWGWAAPSRKGPWGNGRLGHLENAGSRCCGNERADKSECANLLYAPSWPPPGLFLRKQRSPSASQMLNNQKRDPCARSSRGPLPTVEPRVWARRCVPWPRRPRRRERPGLPRGDGHPGRCRLPWELGLWRCLPCGYGPREAIGGVDGVEGLCSPFSGEFYGKVYDYGHPPQNWI